MIAGRGRKVVAGELKKASTGLPSRGSVEFTAGGRARVTRLTPLLFSLSS